MPAVRPTEIKAVAAVLEAEHESAEAAAKAAILALDDSRKNLTRYALVTRRPGLGLDVEGPYATAKAAKTAAETGKSQVAQMSLMCEGGACVVAPLYNPNYTREDET